MTFWKTSRGGREAMFQAKPHKMEYYK